MIVKTIASVVAATVALANMVAPATIGHTGKYKNSSKSSRGILICRDWGVNGCKKGTPKAVLKPGQKSTVYFKDTDGMYVPYGCQITGFSYFRAIDKYPIDASAGRWIKVRGTLGFTDTVTIKCR